MSDKMIVLDGGMGHLLKEQGVQLRELQYDQQFLAGALANSYNANVVIEAHKAYLRAGCNAITTNNFSVTHYSLQKLGREGEADSLIKAAVRNACRATTELQSDALVLGCLPPLKESYHVDSLGDVHALHAEYKQIAACLVAGGVDILLCETLSSASEAMAALSAAIPTGLPVWLSLTLEDSPDARLRSGEALRETIQGIFKSELLSSCMKPKENGVLEPPSSISRQDADNQLREAVKLQEHRGGSTEASSMANAASWRTNVLAHGGLTAVLVNCCHPSAITPALKVLLEEAPEGVRCGAYANGFYTSTTEWLTGSTCEGLERRKEDYNDNGILTPDAYARVSMKWAAMGASIIGGCCGIGPGHMAAVAAKIK